MIYLGVAFVALAYFGTVKGFLSFLDKERERTSNERQRLLNRIANPETVSVQEQPLSDGEIRAVQPDDEKQWSDLLEARRTGE